MKQIYAHPDWRGPLEKKWRWASLKFDLGRTVYQGDFSGNVLRSWWEWSDEASW